MLVVIDSISITVLLLEIAEVEETTGVVEDGDVSGSEGEPFAVGPSPILTQPDLAVIARGHLTFSQLTLRIMLVRRMAE